MRESEEFVSEIRITHVLDCLADPTKIRVMAELSRNVQDILPYVAALLPQAGYNHGAGLLTLVREGRLITIYPQVVTLAKALDEDDARVTLEWLRVQINEAYAQRNEMEPCFERRRSLRLLDAYQLLPKENCRRCGQPTCMAFAALLVFGEARPAVCPRLSEEAFSSNRLLLVEWLGVEE